MAEQLKVTLVRSHIGRREAHRNVLRGMGLTKVNKTVMLQATPEVLGMIRKVSHMVRVEE